MGLTVSAVEQEIINRVGGKLTLAGISTTVSAVGTATNATLDLCIRRAAGELGVIPATPLTIADADLAPLAGWQVEKLADLATLQALRVVLGWLNRVDTKVSLGEQKLHQLVEDVQAQIKALTADLERDPFGPDVPAAACKPIKAGERMPGDVYRRERWEGRRRPPWDFLPG